MISATSLLIGIGCGFATALFANLLVEGFSGWRADRMLKKQRKLDQDRMEMKVKKSELQEDNGRR